MMRSSAGHAVGLVPTESLASVSGSQQEDVGLRQEAEAGGSKRGHTQLFLSEAGAAAPAGLGREEAEPQLTGARDC